MKQTKIFTMQTIVNCLSPTFWKSKSRYYLIPVCGTNFHCGLRTKCVVILWFFIGVCPYMHSYEFSSFVQSFLFYQYLCISHYCFSYLCCFCELLSRSINGDDEDDYKL